jgi:hypothetical protein
MDNIGSGLWKFGGFFNPFDNSNSLIVITLYKLKLRKIFVVFCSEFTNALIDQV